MKRMLCAVTFSPSAPQVVAWAASQAAAGDAELRLFHALPESEERASDTGGADSERALTKLFALARRLPGRPRISAAVTAGDVATEVERHARLIKADLIAIDVPADDERAASLLTRLAADAACPVVVVVVDEQSPARASADGLAVVTRGNVSFSEAVTC